MEKGTFTITLADGTQLHNLTENGNCTISAEAVDEDLLEDENLLEVDIDGEIHQNMTCDNIWEEDGKTWFILRDKTAAELKELEIDAKIDFLMAMQGVM